MVPAALLLPTSVVSLTCAFSNSIQQIRISKPLWPLCILRDLCGLKMIAVRSGHKAHKPARRPGREAQRTQRESGETELLQLQYLNIPIYQYQFPTHHSPLTTPPS